jgi:hypothetical protein
MVRILSVSHYGDFKSIMKILNEVIKLEHIWRDGNLREGRPHNRPLCSNYFLHILFAVFLFRDYTHFFSDAQTVASKGLVVHV